ncbi:MAG: DUF6807 family protein, partial [Armatimonadota bacterium]
MNVKVTAGPHTYANCPMIATIDVGRVQSGGASLVDSAGSRIPCQVFEDSGRTLIAWIEPGLGPGESKEYRFEAVPAGAANSVQIADVGDGKLEVTIGGKLFTRYHYGADWPRPFLYPFIGPGGAAVTRHFPMRDDVPGEKHDHPHHRSVWVAYGEVNGTDNWSEAPGHAFIKHLQFEEITSGPVFGRIRSRNRWDSSDGVPQMEDVREFTFWNLESERLVDVTVNFIAAHGDVVLTDTKEGGIISV